jgi:hypothetical protein
MGEFPKKERFMKAHHKIDYIKIFSDNMAIGIDGNDFSFNLTDISSRLAKASLSKLENYVISASGYGISWPSIEEDISIDGLLGIKHEPDFKKRKVVS